MSSLRDIHRPLNLLRWVGVAVMGIAIVLTDTWTDPESEQVGWVIVAAVVTGSLIAWGWARGNNSDREVRGVGALGFVVDVVLVLGATWVFAFEHGYVLALLPLVPVLGALRYRWLGAALGAAAVVLFLVPTWYREVALAMGVDAPDLSVDDATYIFLIAVSIAIGVVVAAIAQAWHKRQQEFEIQAARLVEFDRLKDRYIAVTTHEIRGPLSAMISAIDTVKARWDKIDPERREHLLEMVYLQGRELDRLVQDLFISAEVQSGGLQLQPEWVELEPILKRAVDAASSKRRGHLLELFVDPLRVELDPYRVSQIIRNLVENAYKYTPDRTRVLVSAKGVPDGIQLEVLDHGEGIPAAKRDLLFEAFSRIEETSAGQEGVGLGLYVVSQLVAAMNGRIDLQSSSRGTIFSIFIPCPTAAVDRRHIGLVGGDEATHG